MSDEDRDWQPLVYAFLAILDYEIFGMASYVPVLRMNKDVDFGQVHAATERVVVTHSQVITRKYTELAKVSYYSTEERAKKQLKADGFDYYLSNTGYYLALHCHMRAQLSGDYRIYEDLASAWRARMGAAGEANALS